jgi:hypothetical protein
MFDETQFFGRKFVNIIFGSVEDSAKYALIECIEINENLTGTMTVILIDDAVKSMNIKRNNFLILLSDAASYMKVAGIKIKELYSEVIHVTCIT